MRRSIVAFGSWAVLYVLLTIALTWPLILHLPDRVPNDLGDSLLNVFLLAWNARELPLTERWWNLPQFHPIPGTMAFSEHLLGLSPITTPVILATGNGLLAYNLAFFLSFPLCALAAHLLGYELTKRHDVGVIAGLAYGFSPYRMSQLAHVQVLSSYWMPLALLGLHLYVRRRHPAALVLFAGAWYMQALACGYYLFYLSVLIGLWLLWFAVGRLPWRGLAAIAFAWGLAIAGLVPIALGYLRFGRMYGLKRWPDEIESFSGDVASLLSASGNLRLWGWLNVFYRAESAFFPGVALVSVILLGIWVAWSGAAREHVQRLRAPRLLLAVALVFGAVALTPVLFGPWRFDPAGIRLLSVSTPQKPLSVAVLLAAVALVLHPSIRAGWTRRSSLVFYSLAAVAMWLFALGPSPTFMGEPLLYKAPYAWLLMLPGVDGVRVPARFWALATLCLALAGGLAVGHIVARWRSLRVVLPGAVAALLLVEAWPEPVPLLRPPDHRPARTAAAARLEVPLGPASDVGALYRAAQHRLPVFNGYSGYFAPHYVALQDLLASRNPLVLDTVAAYGPVEVVVDHHGDPAGLWRAFVRGHPLAEVVEEREDYTIFGLRRAERGGAFPELEGRPVPVAALTASLEEERVEFMVDGDIVSRWDTAGPQGPGNAVVVDVGRAMELRGIELRIGGYVADFPRELMIEVSSDGAVWQPVWSGPTAPVAFQAALQEPRGVPLRFPLRHEGRYIRLRQTGQHPVFYWTIAELQVYAT